MKCFYDFHIHSCLSPCADMEMTPHSIAGMSYINGLNAIAVADHNTAKNIRAVSKAAEEFGVLVIPAIEAETAENIHMLCLFPDIESAEKMGEMLEEHLPDIKNRVDIFGEQCIMNEIDEPIGHIEKLLINATDITIEQMKTECENLGGICIPAHVDREQNGIVAVLGAIPQELGFSTIEFSHNATDEEKTASGYRYVQDSDAHILTNISEKINFMEIDSLSIKEILKKLI